MKKEATRAALITEANRFFHKKGFETTTIDEICYAVSVSRRTFFRYFASKEEIVFPHRAERLRRFLDFVGSAPKDVGVFELLRRSAAAFANDYMENRQHAIAQYQLIQTSSALQAKEAEIDHDWEVEMCRLFMERSDGGPEAEVHARVLAGATLGVIRATMRYWYEGEGMEDLLQLGEEAIDSLERGFKAEQKG
jgi:AcrR family transcriptional regulator